MIFKLQILIFRQIENNKIIFITVKESSKRILVRYIYIEGKEQFFFLFGFSVINCALMIVNSRSMKRPLTSSTFAPQKLSLFSTSATHGRPFILHHYSSSRAHQLTVDSSELILLLYSSLLFNSRRRPPPFRPLVANQPPCKLVLHLPLLKVFTLCLSSPDISSSVDHFNQIITANGILK